MKENCIIPETSRAFICLDEQREIKYWCAVLRCTPDELKRIMIKVGDNDNAAAPALR